MKKSLSLIALALFLTGCASSTQYVKSLDSTQYNTEMAKIYVLRPSAFGSAITMKIYQDDKIIGKLGPGSYLSWEVDPSKGAINVISKSENKDMVTIIPQGGKTYYLKQKIHMGIVIARTELELIGAEEANQILEKLKKPQVNYIE